MRKFAVTVASLLLFGAPAVVRAQDKDITETLAAAGNFKTLSRALADAGLLETLKGPGPFTVLAPSDEAFAKLPAATRDALFKDKSALRNVLLYHVIAGRLTAADFAKLNGRTRKTVEGSDAKVSVSGSDVMIGSARLLPGEMVAKNGVIQPIDAVLLLPR